MSTNFIPGPDAALSIWAANFSAYVTTNATALGVPTTDATALASAVTAFGGAIASHTTAVANAKSVRETKQTDRQSLVSQARLIARRIQANPAVTNTQKDAAGITVPATTRTPAPAPTTVPAATLDTNAGLRQVLRLVDSGTDKRRKPRGAIGAEVYMAIASAPPAGVDQLSLRDVNSSTKVIQEFNSADTGKTAFYAFRWVNTRGDKGPWSDITAATIAA